MHEFTLEERLQNIDELRLYLMEGRKLFFLYLQIPNR